MAYAGTGVLILAGHRLACDPLGRLTRLTLPAGEATAYAYDPAGRLASMTDAAGYTTRLPLWTAARCGVVIVTGLGGAGFGPEDEAAVCVVVEASDVTEGVFRSQSPRIFER